MKLALINASPKPKRSGSGILLDGLRACLKTNPTCCEVRLRTPQLSDESWQALAECDTLVIACPVYVDALPSHMIANLLQLEAQAKENPQWRCKVYAIVNCGFYEGEHTRFSLQILEQWALRCGHTWCDGIGFGSGGMLVGPDIPMGTEPRRLLGDTLKEVAHCIEQGLPVPRRYLTHEISWEEYRQSGDAGWRKGAKKFGLAPEDLDRQL